MALLICIFIISMTSMLLVGVLDTQIGQWSAVRNSIDYERATYLAAAAVNHSLAELEANPAWNAGIANTELPTGSGYTYSATVSVLKSGNIIVTATGTSGAVVRRLQVTVATQ